MEEKIIAVLKKLDTEYNQIYDKALWCKEHTLCRIDKKKFNSETFFIF